MTREMIDIRINYDGIISVRDVEMDLATSKFYFSNPEDGVGIGYICKKDKQDYYVKKILNEIKKEIDGEVKRLLKEQKKIYKMIEKLEVKND